MVKAYMKLYTGDLIRDTGDLTPTEFGIYIRLILWAWDHNGTIPTETIRLAKITGCDQRYWHRAGATVVRRFFTTVSSESLKNLLELSSLVGAVTEQLICYHERVVTELLSYREKCNKNMAAALEMHENRHANAVLSQNQNQNQKKKESPPPSAAGTAPSAGAGTPENESAGAKQRVVAAPPAGFAEFWLAYPNKKSKPAAMRAFANAIKKASLETILVALEQQKPTWKDPKYIKHPSTWLNQECWNDEVAVVRERPEWLKAIV